MMISINGPGLGTTQCEALITAAIDKWQTQKKRRNMPKHIHDIDTLSDTASSATLTPQIEATEPADACIQSDTYKTADLPFLMLILINQKWRLFVPL